MSNFEFDRVESRQDAVFQALGAASMCWEYPEKAGIFESDRAKEIGDALLEKLIELDSPVQNIIDQLATENGRLRRELVDLRPSELAHIYWPEFEPNEYEEKDDD